MRRLGRRSRQNQIRYAKVLLLPWNGTAKAFCQKKKGKHQRKRRSSDSSSGSDVEAIDDPRSRSESQWVSRIEKANLCSKHRDGKQACAILPGGSCAQLTKQDLSLWGLLCKVSTRYCLLFPAVINTD